MFKNFFRKVRATLKNSGEGIAALAGIALPFLPSNPMVQMAAKYLPNLLSAQYAKNPLGEFLKNQAITGLTTKGMEFFNPEAAAADAAAQVVDPNKLSASEITAKLGSTPESSPIYKEAMKTAMATQEAIISPEKTGFFESLMSGKDLSGKGKILGSLAATLGPGLMTYLALMGEDKPDVMDPKEYRSAVDDYYAALDRGENPNPADYGLAPTPAERMVKDLRFDIDREKYMAGAPVARSSGGIASMASGGVSGMINTNSPPLAIDPREELMSALDLRDRAIESRQPVGISATPMGEMSKPVVLAKTGGVVGLALGGLEKRGMVYGPGGPKEDKIPAMLSNGECVMTAKAVDNAGGPNAMYNLMNKLDPESSKGPTA